MDDEERDFITFVGELDRGGDLEGAALGIAKKVVSDGTRKKLSPKQHAAFGAGVGHWLREHFRRYATRTTDGGSEIGEPNCTECTNPVPWCEVYVAGIMNNGICSWCMQLHHKDD